MPDLTKTTPSPGNGPDREEALFMVGRLADAETQIRMAQALKKRVRATCKLRGFNLGQLDLAIKEKDRDDGPTLDNLKDFKKYCEWFDLPVAAHIQITDKPKLPNKDDLFEKAYKRGHSLGVLGADPDWQAFPRISQEGEYLLRGWTDGQKVNHEKLIAWNAQVQLVAEAEEKKRGGKAVGKMQGPMSRHRLDKPGRKTGGRVGADKSPLSSANSSSSPAAAPRSN